jgi:hypothetical protein
MERNWVVDIRKRCREMDVPFFFKQWGGTNKKAAGRLLNGRTFDEMPVAKLRQKTLPQTLIIAPIVDRISASVAA